MAIKICGTRTLTCVSGGATFTTPSPVNGKILAVIVKLGTATTADVKITPSNNTGTNFQIFNKTAITASDIYYPRVPTQDIGGTDVTYDDTNELYTEHVVKDYLAFTISNVSAATATLSVMVYYESGG